MTAMAQNTRLVRGVVFDDNDIPLKGATLSVVGMQAEALSGDNGLFEIMVSPYAKKIEASYEGYLPQQAEIDGSYLVFKMKIDKEYAKNKAKAEEEARIAAEKEAAAKAKAEEEARIAAEKEAEKAAKEAEKARIAAEKEAAAAAKAAEKARVAAEREAMRASKATEKAVAQSTIKDTQRTKPAKEKPTRTKAPRRQRVHSDHPFYRSQMEVSVGADGCMNGLLGMKYIGTFRLTNSLYAGIGMGYCTTETVPLFLHVKYDLTSNESVIKPFAALSFGLASILDSSTHSITNDSGYIIRHRTTTSGDIFINPQLGCNLKLSRKLGTYVSVGYFYDSSVCNDGFHPYHGGFDLHVGVTF